ncbi:MAG: hypothetical protein GC154_17295 [bacterium]|nr:hypothetical protein [bacterium]
MRTAISRAYYALFHAALEKMHDENAALDPRNQHSQVWNYFCRGDELERRWIGNCGHRLKRERQLADYFPSVYSPIGPYPSYDSLFKKALEVMDEVQWLIAKIHAL